MRIGGIDPSTLSTEDLLVLPRGNKQIVFRAVGLSNWDEFDKLCPEPKPGKKMVKGGTVDDFDNKAYLESMKEYGRRRTAYMVVKSLEPSQIEWDKVSLAVPGSWPLWEKELLDNGLCKTECHRVFNLVMGVNSLDEDKLRKARDFFLLGQVMLEASSGPSTEPETTPSGELASA